MTYRSRISVILLLFVLATLGAGAVSIIHTGEYPALFSLGIVLLVVLATFFGIRYTINGDILYVKSLFIFKQKYDLKKLVSIKPTRSILSAPAASLRRIKLDFGCGVALVISPAGQESFIDEVLRINPNVKVEF